MSNIVEVGCNPWIGKINKAKDIYKGCYQKGGHLSETVLINAISTQYLNQCFSDAFIKPDRIEHVARGYLYWEFSKQAKNSRLFTVKPPTYDKLAFFKKISPLNDENLARILPLLNENYLSQLASSDASLFSRCWKVLERNSLSSVQNKIIDCLEAHKVSFTKLFTTLSDSELKTWLSGNLTEAPSKNVSKTLLGSDVEILTFIASKINAEDLERLWQIGQNIWDEDRQSLMGQAILNGLVLRPHDPYLENIYFQVKDSMNAKMDRVMLVIKKNVQGILQEFRTGNPFDTWIPLKK